MNICVKYGYKTSSNDVITQQIWTFACNMTLKPPMTSSDIKYVCLLQLFFNSIIFCTRQIMCFSHLIQKDFQCIHLSGTSTSSKSPRVLGHSWHSLNKGTKLKFWRPAWNRILRTCIVFWLTLTPVLQVSSQESPMSSKSTIRTV